MGRSSKLALMRSAFWAAVTGPFRWLASPRLARGLVAVLAIIFFLAVARGFEPEWFIFVLVVLAVNLLLQAAARALGATDEGLDEMGAELARGEACLTVQIESNAGDDDWAQWAQESMKAELPGFTVRRNSGSMLTFGSGPGRWGAVLTYLLGSFGLFLVFVALAIGFKGKFSLYEGASVQFVEGSSPAPSGFEPFRYQGKPIDGFFFSPWKITADSLFAEVYPGSTIPRDFSAWLTIGSGDAEREFEIRALRPVFHRLSTLHLIGHSELGIQGARIEVVNHVTKRRSRFHQVKTGFLYELRGGRFRVLEFDETHEGMGNAARIEYKSAGKATEHFWIFERYPGYDAIHRVESLHLFELASLGSSFRADFAWVFYPWAFSAWILLGLFALVWSIGSLRSAPARIWISKSDGVIRITHWSRGDLGAKEVEFSSFVAKLFDHIKVVDPDATLGKVERKNGPLPI